MRHRRRHREERKPETSTSNIPTAEKKRVCNTTLPSPSLRPPQTKHNIPHPSNPHTRKFCTASSSSSSPSQTQFPSATIQGVSVIFACVQLCFSRRKKGRISPRVSQEKNWPQKLSSQERRRRRRKVAAGEGKSPNLPKIQLFCCGLYSVRYVFVLHFVILSGHTNWFCESRSTKKLFLFVQREPQSGQERGHHRGFFPLRPSTPIKKSEYNLPTTTT